jgi:hypothetical protein
MLEAASVATTPAGCSSIDPDKVPDSSYFLMELKLVAERMTGDGSGGLVQSRIADKSILSGLAFIEFYYFQKEVPA